MKKTILILLLIISLNSFSQKVDSTKIKFADSVMYLTMNKMLYYSQPYKDSVTANQWELFDRLFRTLCAKLIEEKKRK